MVKLASSTPLSTASVTGGCGCPSIVNVTVPPGVPVPVVVTNAVKVTAWPTLDAPLDEVTRVAVASSGAAFTTWLKAVDEPPLKFPVGVKTAVIVFEPSASARRRGERGLTGRVEVTVLSTVIPSSKLTEPVGVPAPVGPVTVAVRVTGWPTVAGSATRTGLVAVASSGAAFTTGQGVRHCYDGNEVPLYDCLMVFARAQCRVVRVASSSALITPVPRASTSSRRYERQHSDRACW